MKKNINSAAVTISGHLTSDDWHGFKRNLKVSNDPHHWLIAYECFLKKRIHSRYLAPVETIRKYGTLEGEGFAMVSIQCAIIEFLAALRAGMNHSVKAIGEYEYRNSSSFYKTFLCNAPMFSENFDEAGANDFYTSIRCALLHEARTKNGWKIWAEGDTAIDFKKKYLFRNNFQSLIESYLDHYKIELQESPTLQAAFIRKIDHLATS